MKYGYARVSPGGKSESVDAQTRQLTKAGCRKVFHGVHVSGAKTDRAQLRRLLDEIDDGDVLMVTRLLSASGFDCGEFYKSAFPKLGQLHVFRHSPLDRLTTIDCHEAICRHLNFYGIDVAIKNN